jgi:hypothetical protein
LRSRYFVNSEQHIFFFANRRDRVISIFFSINTRRGISPVGWSRIPEEFMGNGDILGGGFGFVDIVISGTICINIFQGVFIDWVGTSALGGSCMKRSLYMVILHTYRGRKESEQHPFVVGSK